MNYANYATNPRLIPVSEQAGRVLVTPGNGDHCRAAQLTGIIAPCLPPAPQHTTITWPAVHIEWCEGKSLPYLVSRPSIRQIYLRIANTIFVSIKYTMRGRKGCATIEIAPKSIRPTHPPPLPALFCVELVDIHIPVHPLFICSICFPISG